MRFRLLAVLAVCVAAWAGSMSVSQLFSFVQSSIQLIKEGKMTDKELADYLTNSKLTERLDDRSVEQMEGLGAGPKTRQALLRLRDQSRALAAAKPIEPPSDPRLEPPPSSEEQAAIIDQVREYALSYSKHLPDFICTQVTRRFAAARPGTRYGGSAKSDPSYRLLDTLTIRLSYFEQKEAYKPILINNSPTSQEYRQLGGAVTTGDFGSMMKEIFERSTQAHFEWDHWAVLDRRPTMVFAYRVDRANSQWHVTYDRRLDVVPAYRGLIYVDTKTHEVTRVTLEAVNLPPDFPVKSAMTILDYRYQDISGHTFLLPLKARTELSDAEVLSRNDTEFRNYRKYQVESELKFDDEAPPPLPEEKTNEAPPAPVKK
jgi:hypothetical protein